MTATPITTLTATALERSTAAFHIYNTIAAAAFNVRHTAKPEVTLDPYGVTRVTGANFNVRVTLWHDRADKVTVSRETTTGAPGGRFVCEQVPASVIAAAALEFATL